MISKLFAPIVALWFIARCLVGGVLGLLALVGLFVAVVCLPRAVLRAIAPREDTSAQSSDWPTIPAASVTPYTHDTATLKASRN